MYRILLSTEALWACVGKLICPYKIVRKKILLWYLRVSDDKMIICNEVLRQTSQLQKLHDLEIYVNLNLFPREFHFVTFM